MHMRMHTQNMAYALRHRGQHNNNGPERQSIRAFMSTTAPCTEEQGPAVQQWPVHQGSRPSRTTMPSAPKHWALYVDHGTVHKSTGASGSALVYML